MIRKMKRGHFLVVCVSDIESIRFGDNHAVTLVTHFLRCTIMPRLNNPIFGDIQVLALVGNGVVPQDQRFAWTESFEPLQKRLK